MMSRTSGAWPIENVVSPVPPQVFQYVRQLRHRFDDQVRQPLQILPGPGAGQDAHRQPRTTGAGHLQIMDIVADHDDLCRRKADMSGEAVQLVRRRLGIGHRVHIPSPD